jgi:hypothetical protein
MEFECGKATNSLVNLNPFETELVKEKRTLTSEIPLGWKTPSIVG